MDDRRRKVLTWSALGVVAAVLAFCVLIVLGVFKSNPSDEEAIRGISIQAYDLFNSKDYDDIVPMTWPPERRGEVGNLLNGPFVKAVKADGPMTLTNIKVSGDAATATISFMYKVALIAPNPTKAEFTAYYVKRDGTWYCDGMRTYSELTAATSRP